MPNLAALAHVLLIMLVAGCLAACSNWRPAECASGRQCPEGATCAANEDICITTPCGDGVVDLTVNEQCDDGNTKPGDGCSAICQIEGCGNGILDKTNMEVCDDGNLMAGDGCSAACRSEFCGNGDINQETNEECDDGNDISGDGCSPLCLHEYCGNSIVDRASREVCDDGGTDSGDGCSTACLSEFCGNGVINANLGENCDDGGTESGDGCSDTCLSEVCGNGIIDVGESCDDLNTAPGDGCSDTCLSEVCGNGVLDVGEVCDDGNLASGDGCSAACHLESCGNGTLEVGESCEDGNTAPGDGCSSTCQAEYCGNGTVDVREECDDNDVTAGDGCSDVCRLEIVQLAAGYHHTCALLATGAVRCWGFSDAGQLGYGNSETIGDNETPASAGDVPLGASATQLAAGYQHTCALLATGAVRCWGSGDEGQLGYGNSETIGDDETPASAGDVPLGASATQLAAGYQHTCALLATGAVRCWGWNVSGQLGYSNSEDIGDNETPASAGDVPLGASATQLAAGHQHTCALLANGAVRCWGLGYIGQLGYGNSDSIGDNETPASAGDVPLGTSATQLAAGYQHTCALLATGAVRCWGWNVSGQLGYSNSEDIGDNETSASAGDVPLGASATQLAAGGDHTCALLAAGAVRCWGNNESGQLGYGNSEWIGDNETPASAGDVPLGASATQLAAGGAHTCALLATGAVRCWGWNNYGQLGYGNTVDVGDDETPPSAGDVPILASTP